MQSKTIANLIGIEFTVVGPDFIVATMPVDTRTVQPFGILHGGASMVLAETLGSVASYMLVSNSRGVRVSGIEIGGSHLRPVSKGKVTGTCRPLRIGKTIHFWRITIRDDHGHLCCDARLTVHISNSGKDHG